MCGDWSIILRKDTGSELIWTDAIDAIVENVTGRKVQVANILSDKTGDVNVDKAIQDSEKTLGL